LPKHKRSRSLSYVVNEYLVVKTLTGHKKKLKNCEIKIIIILRLYGPLRVKNTIGNIQMHFVH
jgi:hypothetical protein